MRTAPFIQLPRLAPRLHPTFPIPQLAQQRPLRVRMRGRRLISAPIIRLGLTAVGFDQMRLPLGHPTTVVLLLDRLDVDDNRVKEALRCARRTLVRNTKRVVLQLVFIRHLTDTKYGAHGSSQSTVRTTLAMIFGHHKTLPSVMGNFCKWLIEHPKSVQNRYKKGCFSAVGF